MPVSNPQFNQFLLVLQTTRGTSTYEPVAFPFLHVSSNQRCLCWGVLQPLTPALRWYLNHTHLGRTPHSHPSPNLSHYPHIWGHKISQSFIYRQPPNSTPLGSTMREKLVGQLPPFTSIVFMTWGSEHVLTSQEPISPTLTSRSWRHICLPATPQWAHCPLQARPSSSSASFTCRFPQAQLPSSPSREIPDAFRCSWIQIYVLFPCSPLLS